MYLLVLLVATRLAAAAVSMAVLLTWASAYVSGIVTSHASGFPRDHVRIVVASGRLPSHRSRPTGSLTIIIIFDQGKPPGHSKITKVTNICLVSLVVRSSSIKQPCSKTELHRRRRRRRRHHHHHHHHHKNRKLTKQ